MKNEERVFIGDIFLKDKDTTHSTKGRETSYNKRIFYLS